MGRRKPSNRSLVTIAIAWQVVVYALALGGVFVEIFHMLGILWNSRGLINVIGVTVGFILLELPLAVFLVYAFRRRSKKDPL